MKAQVRKALQSGLVIPACPLALTASRKLDERRQRALFRYYLAAGAGGLAVGVHTTQFAIRDPKVGLFQPVLELAAQEMERAIGKLTDSQTPRTRSQRSADSLVRLLKGADGGRADKAVRAPARSADLESYRPVRIAGVCGTTRQAVREASLISQLGYDAALLSLGALKSADEDQLLDHCRAVAEILPLIGFYLQPSVGGRVLPFSFWRRFAEIKNVIAIKIAPFNRYQTIDVIRAVAESGRTDIALYTGNDDNIILDLLTAYRFASSGSCSGRLAERRSPTRRDLFHHDRAGSETGAPGPVVARRIVGGLLGQWAVWTVRAVELLAECHAVTQRGGVVPTDLLRRNIELTDANAAIFDAAHGFAGCIPGIHEILRRQGLLEGVWCLDPKETLSPGQAEEIDRVCRAYPQLTDDAFVAAHREKWLTP